MPNDRGSLANDTTRGVTFCRLADAAPDAMVLIDAVGTVLWANQSMLELLDQTQDALVGSPLANHLGHRADPVVARNLLDAVLTPSQTTSPPSLQLASDDGTDVILDVAVIRVSQDGGPLHMLTLRDVTEATRTREALAESEERFALAMLSSGNALWDWRLPSNKLYLSPQWKAQLGYANDELENSFDTFAMLLHPDDREATIAASQAWVAAPEGMWRRRFRMRHKDGRWRWIEARGAPVVGDDGSVCRLLGTHIDLTEQVEAEERIRVSEERFRTLIENLRDGFGMLDAEGRFTFVNDSLCQMLGHDPNSMLGSAATEFLTETGCRALASQLEHRRKGGTTPYELEWRHADGHPIPTIISPRLLVDSGGPVGSFATVTDISELKTVQQELEESKTFVDTILNTIPEIVYIFDLVEDRNIFTNDGIRTILGWTIQDVRAMGTNLFPHLLHPDDMEAVIRHHRRLAAAGDDEVLHLEYRLQAKSGDWRTLRSSDRVFARAENGAVTRIIGAAMDITARKEAEEASAIFRQLVEQSGQGLGLVGADGRVLYANPALLAIVGLDSVENATGTSLLQYYDEESRERLQNEVLPRVLAGEKWQGVNTVMRRNGTEVPVLEHHAAVTSAEGVQLGVSAAITDITSERQIQDELRRTSEDLRISNRELEQFAYVASHDLQEPLRMVASYLQLLERRYRDALDDDARDFIDFAVDGAKRMKALIQALLDYSRIDTRKAPPVTTDLEQVVEDIMTDLHLTIRDLGATVIVGDLPTVAVDRDQISRALANLVTNALKFHSDRPPEIRVEARENNGHHIISVSDNGIGIPPQHQERVFDIFQRLHARQEYSGTGMGLAIVRRIAEQHGGDTWVESVPGVGSTFFLSIPR